MIIKMQIELEMIRIQLILETIGMPTKMQGRMQLILKTIRMPTKMQGRMLMVHVE